MVTCVFPGSFDPVTSGHVHLISRTAAMFDRVTVAVMINLHKKGSIPVEKRIELLKTACAHMPNVRIVSWDGLLSDFMRINNEKILVRGIRNGADYDQECASICANRMLNRQMETLLIPSDPEYTGVSSSAVREIASFGGNIEPFVPDGLSEEIMALLSNDKAKD